MTNGLGGPRRRLPRVVRPFHDETVASYLDRIAAANCLTEQELKDHLGVKMLKKTPVTVLLEPLTIVTGYSEAKLRLALPEFIAGDQPDTPGHFGRPLATRHKALRRLACRCCALAAGIALPVTCWTTHDRNVCLRHQLWIGEGCQGPDNQLDVSGLPMISRAQRHHRNLISRHGRPWVFAAFRHAREIFEHWYDKHRPDFRPAFDQRCQQLSSTRPRAVTESEVLPAVLHREIVVLTGLLASNYWEHVVYTLPNGGERYTRELEARGIPTGIILAENDPLIEYLRHQLSTYRFLSHHWRLRDSLFPDETTRHPKPRRPETSHRLFPVLR